MEAVSRSFSYPIHTRRQSADPSTNPFQVWRRSADLSPALSKQERKQLILLPTLSMYGVSQLIHHPTLSNKKANSWSFYQPSHSKEAVSCLPSCLCKEMYLSFYHFSPSKEIVSWSSSDLSKQRVSLPMFLPIKLLILLRGFGNSSIWLKADILPTQPSYCQKLLSCHVDESFSHCANTLWKTK